MLVLALEFSRGMTARALPTTNCGCSGTHGASGHRPTLEKRGRRRRRGNDRMVAPSKRNSESPTPYTGAGSVSDGLPTPEGGEAVRHPPAYIRGRIASVQLGSGQF
jgi:hypothetical protein